MFEFVDKIRESEDFLPQKPVTDDAIKQTEKKLKLVFADDYKAFLLHYGAALLGDKEINGICDAVRLSVVEATERARSFFPEFPKDAYVIEELHIDHIITIQKADGVVYSYGPADKAKKIADSLGDYLLTNI